MTRPLISVVIITYNSGAERLAACLQSLEEQRFSDFEVIVFDNASTDGAADEARNRARTRLIQSEVNLGFAGGVNAAAREATGEWLALLNPDTIAEPGWLEAWAAGIKRYPDTRIFGAVQIDMADRSKLDGLGDYYHPIGVAWRGAFGKSTDLIPDGDCEIMAPCGAAALYHRDVFEALGGMEESFFCYMEDVDFGLRAHLIREKAILIKDAVIYHEGSGTTGRYSDFTVYHGNRNRIRTFIRTMPPLLFWPLLPVHVAVNLAFLARAAMIGTGRPCARAVWDGFFNSASAWRQRGDIQRARKIRTTCFAKALTWPIMKLLRREADLRPVRASATKQLRQQTDQ